MQRLANETRDYFVRSFDRQAFDGKKWDRLKTRTEPPDKLNVTGTLKSSVQNSIVSVTSRKVVMEADAVDSRGRHYSDFQNDGTVNMVARTFMPRQYIEQPAALTKLQLMILKQETGKVWEVK